MSDEKLEECIKDFDADRSVCCDVLVPRLAYDLLVDNCRLRKLANQFQLRVLLIHKGKDVDCDPEATLPQEERVMGLVASNKAGGGGGLFSMFGGGGGG